MSDDNYKHLYFPPLLLPLSSLVFFVSEGYRFPNGLPPLVTHRSVSCQTTLSDASNAETFKTTRTVSPEMSNLPNNTSFRSNYR